MSEKERRWIEKAQTGDNRAFNRLINKYRDQMYYLAYNLCGNEEDAKDIAQDAFIKAYEHLRQFKMAAGFSTWLHRITVNQAFDHIRKQSRLPKEIIDDNAIVTAQPVDNSGPDDALQAALNQLSNQQRQVVILKYYHHFSYEEIAETLNCAQSTVRNHMLRAMKHLRVLLGQAHQEK